MPDDGPTAPLLAFPPDGRDPDAGPATGAPAGPPPTGSGIPMRRGDFPTLVAALAYAARGRSGLAFHDQRGALAEALPYRDLAERAAASARRLRGAGFRRGDRVGIVAATGADLAVSFFACQLAGVAPAPLPLPLSFAGREAWTGHVGRVVRAEGLSGLLAPPSMRDWIEGPAAEAGLRFAGSLADLDAAPDGAGEPPADDPDAVAYLQFSSGSTRFPAAVAVTQRALMANLRGILEHGLAVRPGDRGVSWLPLYHDMGLVGFLLGAVAGQVSIDYLAPQSFARRPLLWLEMISRSRATLSYSPAFGFELCVRRLRGAPPPELDLSSWRAAGVGGDMIRPAALRAFADAFAPRGFDARAFLPSYGLAEAVLAASFSPHGRGMAADRLDLDRLEAEGLAVPAAPDARRSREFVLCGRPLPGHRLDVLGPDGAPLPDRRVGRIVLSGPSVAAPGPDGRLDTGDRGYLLDGEVVVTGRDKDVVIVNGRNVWPQDIEWTAEAAAAAAVGMRSARAAAVPVDGDAGEAAAVLLETALADPTERAALAEAVAGAVRAAHGVDAAVTLVAPGALPLTSSGKLSRAGARRLLGAA
jgi:fatty-acyl-CoA synthase